MKLHVTDLGDGPRLAILLHGGTVDSRIWHHLGPRMAAAGWRVLTPDLRGHGQSPRGSYSIEEWADDLVDNLPSGADLIVGHSLGGTVLSLAVERLRPRRAVYAEPGFEHDVKPAGYFARKKAALATLTGPELAAAEPGWTAGDVEAFLAGMRCCDPAVLDSVGALADRHTNYVPSTAVVPSLLLVAERGSVVRPQTAHLLSTRGFEVRTVPGVGHNLQLDHPDSFLRAIGVPA